MTNWQQIGLRPRFIFPNHHQTASGSKQIGGGRTRLQPVYVEDVAEATAHILADTATAGRSYELAGPEVYTMRELVMIVLRIVGRRRALVSVPFAVARLQARLSGFLPNPPQSDS